MLGMRHLERRHVRAAARAVHGEEAEARDVHAVEMVIRVGHELARLLGRGVRRDGEVDHVGLGEERLLGTLSDGE